MAGTASLPVPTPIYRKQVPVTYPGSGNTQVIKLNKTLVYRDLRLELTAAPTLTAGNNTAANTAFGDEWGVLKNIVWKVNGSDVLRSMSGDDLFWLNYLWYGQSPALFAGLADGATANPSIDSSLVIPAWKPRAFHPMDTAIDSGRFNDVSLEITFGNYTDINSAATAWTTNPTVNVLSHEQILPTDGTDQPSVNWVVKKLSNSPAGANNSYRVPLDAGVNYTDFVVRILKSDGTADAGSTTYATAPSALVSNAKVVGAGGRVYFDAPWTDLVQYQRQRSGLPQTVTRKGQASNHGAVGWISLTQDGYLKEGLPNPNDAYLEFNVLGACRIDVLVSQIFPIG